MANRRAASRDCLIVLAEQPIRTDVRDRPRDVADGDDVAKDIVGTVHALRAALHTTDRCFARFPGLKYVNPLEMT